MWIALRWHSVDRPKKKDPLNLRWPYVGLMLIILIAGGVKAGYRGGSTTAEAKRRRGELQRQDGDATRAWAFLGGSFRRTEPGEYRERENI